MVTIEGIDCYGEMNIFRNIEIVCDDEENDSIWPNGFHTWEEAVDYLSKYYHDMVQLTAV
jgi:hypothetical protein